MTLKSHWFRFTARYEHLPMALVVLGAVALLDGCALDPETAARIHDGAVAFQQGADAARQQQQQQQQYNAAPPPLMSAPVQCQTFNNGGVTQTNCVGGNLGPQPVQCQAYNNGGVVNTVCR
jgi:hypothetical protein